MSIFAAVLPIFLLPICIADLSNLKIPNIYNRLLLYCAIVSTVFNGINFGPEIFSSLSFLVVLFIVGVGMGDIKLLAIIICVLQISNLSFFGYIFLAGAAHILISATSNRKIPSKIALAPSIFIGLATYLATR